MHYWHSVLSDVLNNKNHIRAEREIKLSEKTLHKIKEPRDLRTYYLGDQYPGVYLTKREAECMFWIVQNHTIGSTALKMQLSARTVEFYVKNMKLKLHCASKKQLIEKILQTHLLQQLDNDGMRIVKH